ncbi:hypothetical protein EON63_08840 [archaeon]|nr:MAG: hypothetical protein EON63_08840 [archaeon]
MHHAIWAIHHASHTIHHTSYIIQNITDIDDKIILRAAERGMSYRELASVYEKEFVDDMAALHVKLPDICTRYIPI